MCIVGELHEYAVNASILEQIFHDHGWSFEFSTIADDHANFQACSPAAVPLLASMAGIRPAVSAQVLQGYRAQDRRDCEKEKLVSA